MDKETFKYAFFKSLPVMAGYLFLGAGFGILLQSKGYSPIWAVFMCIFIFAGSMQYVAVDLLAAGASLISAAFMTLMVNARHIFYEVSMLAKYKKAGKFKPYIIFALTDETYSLVCSEEAPKGIDQNKFYFYLSLLDHLYWIIGGFLGALLGTLITFDSTGIDFSMTALFVVIFVEQLEKKENYIPAIVGVLVTAICLIIFKSDSFLIPSMIGITIALFIFRGRLEKGDEAK